uniref:SH2 domain-containing protein n=1 Tax=Angiostrongylus cantonensis TaxID=6313 RepID=A0A0K0DKP9_ANGCA
MRAPRANLTDQNFEDVQRRESEIFQSIQEKRERIRQEAEAESERQRLEWEKQNKRARDAEEAMRKMAQKAREQHRQLIRTTAVLHFWLPHAADCDALPLKVNMVWPTISCLKSWSSGSDEFIEGAFCNIMVSEAFLAQEVVKVLDEVIFANYYSKNLPRPPKPKSRAAIVDWFKRDEWPRGTGQDPKTRMPAPWFHGIISRDQAEILLQDKPTGSFLVRVSERIWGYTVSYVVGDGTYKHFLVERIPEGYQFLGTNQVVHDQLFDLVSYHETAPITAKGGEVLKWSVGQIFRPPDYHDIVPEFAVNRLVGRF